MALFDGYAETIMLHPSLYDAVEVHGVRDLQEPDRVEKHGTICEVDDDDPQFFSVYAHLREGGCECIGDFETAADAVAYGMLIGCHYSLPMSIYFDRENRGETTGNSERDVAQWYVAAATEAERREMVGSVNCERGLAKSWNRLTFEGQTEVKARRLHVITTGLRLAADLATKR
jgi:hypothetical protein